MVFALSLPLWVEPLGFIVYFLYTLRALVLVFLFFYYICYFSLPIKKKKNQMLGLIAWDIVVLIQILSPGTLESFFLSYKGNILIIRISYKNMLVL